MPVPNIISVPAHRVMPDDDLLVNRRTKELDENGEPMPQERYADVGEKWVYLRLAEPLGRKRTFQVDIDALVPVIRMEDTYEDKVRKANRSIARDSLDAHFTEWRYRAKLEQAATEVSQPRRVFYSRSSAVQVASASKLQDIVNNIAEAEAKANLWKKVEAVWLGGEADSPVAALQQIVDKLKRDIIEGFMSRDEDLTTMRRFIRDAERVHLAKLD